MKPRARWVRQSSQWRNLSTPPTPCPLLQKKNNFFPPTTSAGLLCLACLCYLSSSLRTWTTSRLCLCKSAVAPFALRVASLGQMKKKKKKEGRKWSSCSRSCSALFTPVAYKPTEDQVCLFVPSLLLRKRGKLPETEWKSENKKWFCLRSRQSESAATTS